MKKSEAFQLKTADCEPMILYSRQSTRPSSTREYVLAVGGKEVRPRNKEQLITLLFRSTASPPLPSLLHDFDKTKYFFSEPQRHLRSRGSRSRSYSRKMFRKEVGKVGREFLSFTGTDRNRRPIVSTPFQRRIETVVGRRTREPRKIAGPENISARLKRADWPARKKRMKGTKGRRKGEREREREGGR